jgi:hypothetical protein
MELCRKVIVTLCLARASSAFTFAPPQLTHGRPTTALFAAGTPSPEATVLKRKLLHSIDLLRTIQAFDGDVSVDFGEKGGEINATSRAPQKVDFYAVSPSVGMAADDVVNLCDQLAAHNPTAQPTKFLGDRKMGEHAPLDGPWRLLFTTAADATFSLNSTRGDALVQNIVYAAKGRMANVIDFLPREGGQEPLLKQLRVIIAAKALSDFRVSLKFRYVKATFCRFFRLPIRWSLYIPVPATFFTRIIVFYNRILRFRGKVEVKKPPEAYFDVLYLDEELRVHRTGEDNTFVQARPTCEATQGLFQ